MKVNVFDGLVPQEASTTRLRFETEADEKVFRALIDKFQTDSESGDFFGLVDRFRLEPHAHEKFRSWVSSSSGNLSIGPAEVSRALGNDYIQEIATLAELPEPTAVNSVAKVLPIVVHELSPVGVVPSPKVLRFNLDSLRKRYFSHR